MPLKGIPTIIFLIKRWGRVGPLFFDISLFGHEDSGVTMKPVHMLGLIVALDLSLVADHNIGRNVN